MSSTSDCFKELKWRLVKTWLELDDSIAVSSAAVSSIGNVVECEVNWLLFVGTEPTPRYGQVMVMNEEGVITMFAGSGSMYLNDIVLFNLNDDEE